MTQALISIPNIFFVFFMVELNWEKNAFAL